MIEPTISAGYANALVKVCLDRGAARDRLLERAGIKPDQLADPDSRLPFERFKALMRAGKELCADPALGLHFGAESRFAEMSIVGLICYAAETMGEGFEQLNRYARLVIEVDGHESGPRFAIVRDGAGVWLEDRRRNPNDFPELTESTWARFIGDNRRAFPDRVFATAVQVTHPAPAYLDEYERVLGAPVAFESARNALLIDEGWLSLRTGIGSRYVFGVFSDKALALLNSLDESKLAKDQVEAMLIPVLHTGALGMDEVARRMGLSRATLYRRLKAEGVGYDDLLDDLRRRMASHYLSGKKVSVNETAYLVGFSDPAAFSRAFKRWTGASPSSLRRT